MDEGVVSIFEAAIYAVGAVGVAYVIAKHWCEARKEYFRAQLAKIEVAKQLLQPPEYQQHLQDRAELPSKLAVHEAFTTVDSINEAVNNAYGELSIDLYD